MPELCLTEQIGEILGERKPKLIPDDKSMYSHAGVLIPLFDDHGVCHVLFTKRTDTVEHHKSQISFPGGKVDDEDRSVEETALRETFEEIGVDREQIEILGRIDDTLTIVSNFLIHPFVGLVPYPDNLSICSAEVDSIIKVPLSRFFPENVKEKMHLVEYDGMTINSLGFKYRGDLIWGATARMMDNFINIIIGQL
jgi:8-oxo-dGTP pyrophosphatase MutT (NUDIX family)